MATRTIDISQATIININPNLDKEDEFSNIPLCINDIISICMEYNKLGYNIQHQINNIVELGVDESIKSEVVKVEALPYIKDFLYSITRNPYFGEAIDQAKECIFLIKEYESVNKKNNLLLN